MRTMRTLTEIATRHGLTVKEMMRRDRSRTPFMARAESFDFLARRGWSYPEIGDFFGLDHTSVLHAVQRFRAITQVEPTTVPEPAMSSTSLTVEKMNMVAA